MPKTFQPTLTTSVLATTALVKNRFAGLVSGNYCASGAKALGAIQANTDSGEMAPVDVLGIVLVESGDAINAGAEVQSGNNGVAIPKTSGLGNGYALDAASTPGDVIRVIRGI